MVRISDTLKQQNDLTSFPVAFGDSIWLNKDKNGATEDYSDLQTMYNNDLLGSGGSSIQVDTMPIASVDELGKIYEFIGSTGTYVNGYFYECVSDGEPTPTYSWVQKNVQPNVNIVDTAIEIDSTWSSKKINDSLVNITDKLEKNVKFDVDDLNTAYVPNKTITVRTNKNTKNLPPSPMVNFLVTSFACVEGQYYRITQYCYENSENLSCSMYVRRGVSNAGESSITWSAWQELATSADLADKQDFRIFKSLEEFNEKKGTSLTVVSGIDNMKDIANAMSNGEMLIIITRYELASDVYFGLTTGTGWTKMFTFVKSNGLCDVECRTTFPLTLKRVLNSDGVVGDWQQLATTDSTLKTIQLSGSVDCNTLTEPGLYTASSGAVTSITNTPADIGSAVQMAGGFSVLVTKTNVDGVYYGMQMFIPYGSDVPFIRKSYYLNGQYWTDWQELATQSDLNSKGVFKGNIVPNKKLTISMDPYSEVYGYVQVEGIASIPFRLHNAALDATPTVFLKRSVTINGENVYVDKPFGTTVSIGPVTIANTNGVWTITNASSIEPESYWVGGGVNSVSLSDA